MPGTASNPTHPEPARRDLAPAGDISQDQVADTEECECDDCDCPVCYPGCC